MYVCVQHKLLFTTLSRTQDVQAHACFYQLPMHTLLFTCTHTRYTHTPRTSKRTYRRVFVFTVTEDPTRGEARSR